MDAEDVFVEYTRAKIQRDVYKSSLTQYRQEFTQVKEQVDAHIKAKWVITEVAMLTQKKFQDKIDSLITMAIKSVFNRPFEFHLEIQRKRDRMECKSVIVEGDKIYSNLEYGLGGGMLDIIGFAARVVLWTLENPRSRNVIVMDEPMKNLGKMVTLGGRVLQEISRKLGLQLIIITHDDEVAEIGDRIFEITHEGRSRVNIIKGQINERARIAR